MTETTQELVELTLPKIDVKRLIFALSMAIAHGQGRDKHELLVLMVYLAQRLPPHYLSMLTNEERRKI